MNSSVRRSLKLFLLTAGGLFVWTVDTDAVHAEATIEEVVVTGIRQSQVEALDIKRESANFIDAISAEDVGKLPDSNVAEALQRVTGVAIQRDRGEGDFVSIRGLGPDFVRGTINGRTVLSATEAFDSTLSGGFASRTGRATNFDILPSEIIQTLTVVKSPSAEHVEGGIGGVVDVATARPLDLGRVASGTVQGTYRDFNDEFDPNASGLVSWTNLERSLGLMAGIAYSKRNIREDFDRSFGWLAFGSYDSDLDGAEDMPWGSVFLPLANNADSYEEERERVTFTGTLQSTLDEYTQLTVDVLYTERDLNHSQSSAILVSLPIGPWGNEDGSFRVPAANFDGNTLPALQSVLGNEMVSDLQDNRDELFTLGVNVNRQLGQWAVNVDASYAAADGQLAFDRMVAVNDAAAGGTVLFDYVVDDEGFQVAHLGTADIPDPANYFLRNGRVTRTGNEDDEYAFQFDVSRIVDGDFLTAVKTGVRYRNRDKSLERSDWDAHFRIDGAYPLRLSAVSGAFHRGNSDFLDGDWGGSPGYDGYIFADATETLAHANAQGFDTTPGFDPLGTFTIEEQTLAAYVQLDLAGELGDVGFVGDVGVRVVRTQQDIEGFSRPFTISGGSLIFTSPDNEVVEFEDDSVAVLPSLNLRLELNDDLYLRLAASKSLTRPTFNDLSPQVRINPSATIDLNQDGVAATAILGNTALQPYESTNVDFGVEWYFGEASALFGGFFYKSVDEYIAVVTNLDVTFEGVVFDSVSQPDNQGEADVVGGEVGYQQAFPSGLGYIMNVTFTENDAEFDGGGDIPFPGVSDLSYNLVGYFDRGPWQARLAYSYRSDYLLLPNDVFANEIHTESYGQLDGSVSYEVADGITVLLSGLNLTAENSKLNTVVAGVDGSRFLSESHVGRRISVGVRATF